MAITGPLFKWFGSKWQSAPKYPKPLYSDIYEPFAGGAGYALRYYWKNVTIFDSNPILAELWNWLIKDATYQLIMDIPVDLEEKVDIRLISGLGRGQQLLLRHWQRTNNCSNTWHTSPWGNLPGQWTKNTRERISNEVYEIKHWKFQPISWQEKGTYFVDPPYEFNYRYGFNNFDFALLARKIHSMPVPHQLIACEAICKKTGAIPNWLPFKFFTTTVTSRRRKENSGRSHEVMYYEHKEL